jgi:hypothetical protein
VEVWEEAVTVRATRNTFTAQRKDSFIRELAAEGFIPDDYRWASLEDADSPYRGIHWTVDCSWLTVDEDQVAGTQRFVFGIVVSAALMLILLVGVVLAGHPDAAGAHRAIPASAPQHTLGTPS